MGPIFFQKHCAHFRANSGCKQNIAADQITRSSCRLQNVVADLLLDVIMVDSLKIETGQPQKKKEKEKKTTQNEHILKFR